VESPLEDVSAKAERGLRPRRQFRLEILNVSADRLACFRRRVCEIAQDMQVIETRECAGQVDVDERRHAAPRFEANLHE